MRLDYFCLGLIAGLAIMLAVLTLTPEEEKPFQLYPGATTRCLLDVTGFDPYMTTENTMVGAMRICMSQAHPDADVTPNRKGD